MGFMESGFFGGFIKGEFFIGIYGKRIFWVIYKRRIFSWDSWKAALNDILEILLFIIFI